MTIVELEAERPSRFRKILWILTACFFALTLLGWCMNAFLLLMVMPTAEIPVTFWLLLAYPPSVLIGQIWGWRAWLKGRSRLAWRFQLLPLVFGLLHLVTFFLGAVKYLPD